MENTEKFGTVEYYGQKLVELDKEREILLHALKDVAKDEVGKFTDYTLLYIIAEKLIINKNSKEFTQEQLSKVMREQGIADETDDDYRGYND